MNKIALTLFTLSLIFAVNSCSLSGGKTGDKNKIEFDTLKADSTYHLLGDTAKPSININVKLLIPKGIEDKEICSKIQNRMLYDALELKETDPNKAITLFMDNLIKEYKNFETEFSANEFSDEGIGSSFAGAHDASQEVVFNQDEILSILTTSYSFTGGAHGLTILKYSNFDLKDGKNISLSDIFVDDYESMLTPIILDKIARSNNVTDPKQLEDQGFFEISDIKPTENFYLDDKGITFLYNQYEIACYAMGQVKAFIPYNEISFLISSKSIINKYL
ncbi:MAG: DUF3298 domain-containing protein [Paludibacteraceae bacterium]